MFRKTLIFCLAVLILSQQVPKVEAFTLPQPGQMVPLSQPFTPVVLKGIKLDPNNPFRFHFYLSSSTQPLSSPNALVGDPQQEQLKTEANKLIKYFLASLTTPEKDLWVNLSPYEKDRIVPESFGQTAMGRDLLAQDYLLKQITASLIYPESDLGKKFWKEVYAKAQAQFGSTNIPVNTFNKVWIVPEKAVVYEHNGAAFILENHLKVMLEEDYLAHSHSVIPAKAGIQNLSSDIIRKTVIPILEKEVNEGKNFAQLRQVFNSLILATWYKNKIKDSILNKVLANQNKIKGVNIDPQNKQQIYNAYLAAFKKGVYNYIKEESDAVSGKNLLRKYFSGGVNATDFSALAMKYTSRLDKAQVTDLEKDSLVDLVTDFSMTSMAPSNTVNQGLKSILKLNPYAFGIKFKGETEQELELHSIKRVEAAFQRFAPQILLEYREYVRSPDTFPLSRLYLLKEHLYDMKSSQFSEWGLSFQTFTAFNGSYIKALIKTFPKLNLNEYAFISDQTSDEAIIKSVRAKIERFKPELWLSYKKYIDDPVSMSSFDLNELKNRFYAITQADLQTWKLSAMFSRRQAAIFEGSYIKTIQKSFPELQLEKGMFKQKYGSGSFNWSGGLETGISIVREVLKKEIPYIWQEYQRYVVNPKEFSSEELRSLKEEFYKINSSNFGAWKLRGALSLISAPYFEGRLSKVIAFSVPELHLNENAFFFKFSGDTPEEAERNGIISIRAALERFKPDLWKEYEEFVNNAENFNQERINRLKEEFYEIKYSNLNAWGLSSINKVSKGTGDAIAKAFKSLQLNPLAFQAVFEGKSEQEAEENGIKSVQAAIERFRPDIWKEYQRFLLLRDSYSFKDYIRLKELIYQLESKDFSSWGLLTAGVYQNAPYFEGSYAVALKKSFSELNLNTYAFISQWSGETPDEAKLNGIRSVQAAIERYEPEFWRDYIFLKEHPQTGEPLKLWELKQKAYSWKSAHFSIWGIAKAGTSSSAPYFGSYKIALQHSLPELGLDINEFKGSQTEPRFSWGDGLQSGIENVRAVVAENLPDVWNEYQRYVSFPKDFSVTQLANIKEQFYRISTAHFLIWGITKALDRETIPEFEGSHIKALALSFPEINLNPYAASYVLNGETLELAKANGIRSVRAALERFMPELWAEYKEYENHPENLSAERLQKLLNNIYKINTNDFRVWGLSITSRGYFHSYVEALIESLPALSDKNMIPFQAERNTEIKEDVNQDSDDKSMINDHESDGRGINRDNEDQGTKFNRRTFLRVLAAAFVHVAASSNNVVTAAEKLLPTKPLVKPLSSYAESFFSIASGSFLDPYGFTMQIRGSQIYRYSIENLALEHLTAAKEEYSQIIPELERSTQYVAGILKDMEISDKRNLLIKQLREQIIRSKELQEKEGLFEDQDELRAAYEELIRASDEQLGLLFISRIKDVANMWKEEAEEEGRLFNEALLKAEEYERENNKSLTQNIKNEDLSSTNIPSTKANVKLGIGSKQKINERMDWLKNERFKELLKRFPNQKEAVGIFLSNQDVRDSEGNLIKEPIFREVDALDSLSVKRELQKVLALPSPNKDPLSKKTFLLDSDMTPERLLHEPYHFSELFKGMWDSEYMSTFLNDKEKLQRKIRQRYLVLSYFADRFGIDRAMNVVQKEGVGTNVSWNIAAIDFPVKEAVDFIRDGLPIGSPHQLIVSNKKDLFLTGFYDPQHKFRILNFESLRRFIKKIKPRLLIGAYFYQVEANGVRIFNSERRELAFTQDQELHSFLEWKIHTYLTLILTFNNNHIPLDQIRTMVNKSRLTSLNFTKDHVVWQAGRGIKGTIEKLNGQTFMLLPDGNKQESLAFNTQMKWMAKFALAIARQTLSGLNGPVTGMPSELDYQDILPKHDASMLVNGNINSTKVQKEGGINLNPAQMTLETKHEGQNFHFNFKGQDIDSGMVIGAEFEIKQMTPVTDLPFLLGLK